MCTVHTCAVAHVWKCMFHSSTGGQKSQHFLWKPGDLCLTKCYEVALSRTRPRAIGKLDTPPCALRLFWPPSLAAVAGSLSLGTFQSLLGSLVSLEEHEALMSPTEDLSAFLVLMSERPHAAHRVPVWWLTTGAVMPSLGLHLRIWTWQLLRDLCWFNTTLLPGSASTYCLMAVDFFSPWDSFRQKFTQQCFVESPEDRGVWKDECDPAGDLEGSRKEKRLSVSVSVVPPAMTGPVENLPFFFPEPSFFFFLVYSCWQIEKLSLHLGI